MSRTGAPNFANTVSQRSHLSIERCLTQQANRRPTSGRKPAGGRPVERRVRPHAGSCCHTERLSAWALRSLAVLVVLLGSLDRSQPRLAAFDPELVAWHEWGGSFWKDAELDFGLAIVEGEQARPAARTEVLAVELGRFAYAIELLDGPNPIESKRRPALLSAVGAVADACAHWLAARADLHLPAKALAREHFHARRESRFHGA